MTERHGKDQSLTARAAWFMFARTLALVLSFALPLLLVRRLSQHEFGLYKQAFLIVGTALTTLPLGLGMSAFYFLPREHERRGTIVLNILVCYAVTGGAACLVFLLYPQSLAVIFNSAELVQYAPMIGLVSLLWLTSSFLEIVVIANQEARLASVFIIGSQFTKALLLLAAAIPYGSVSALLYAALIQGLVQTAILLRYLHSRFPGFWRDFNWTMMREQLAYALPLGFAALLLRTQSDVHNYFVSYRFGADVYAIYSIGCFNILLVDLLTDSIGSVMIPRVSYLQSLHRTREIIEVIARMTRKLAAVLFPLYVFLLITGREVIILLFTDRYVASWPIFAINLTVIPLALIASAYDPVIRAYPEHRYFLIRLRAVLLVVLLATLWLTTKYYGPIGAIAAVVGVSSIERLVTAVRYAKVLGFTRRDAVLFRDPGKLAVSALAAGLLTMVARSLMVDARPLFELAACGLVFTLAYASLVLASGVVTLEERDAIRRPLSFVQRFVGARRAVDPVVDES
jgi:O-antigen/teichoic acid export membrane protein